jgi:hypothetical protein
MKTATEVFADTISKEFKFLKETSTLEQLYARGLNMKASGGMLIPLCRLHADDQELIKTLSQWRRENYFAYPTRFPVTDAGTASWLTQRLLDVPDRILFLVHDKHGHSIGHLGFASCLNSGRLMEVDNVVRGVKDSAPGLMRDAMIVLTEWARTTLWPEGFFLRVLASNDHAVKFYQKLGFSETARFPLRQKTTGETTTLSPLATDDTAPPDEVFIRMDVPAVPTPTPVGQSMILTAGPSISPRECGYATEAVRYGWNSQWSGYLKAFEKGFADYIGVKHAIATSSCTGALHIALTALGVGPGDEVIVPDITWVATANAVLYVGATPIFADVEPVSWCLDPSSFASKITPRTKAVIPVHLYGHPCNMRSLPNMAVVAPADPWETRAATQALLRSKGPSYLRLGKAHEPSIHQHLPSFTKGKVIGLAEGTDALIVSTGGMLVTALAIRERLSEQGLSVAVWSCPWLKPLDTEAIREAALRYHTILTVEEAYIGGGLGGAVAEVIAGVASPHACLIRAGTGDRILTEANSQQAARKALGLDADTLSSLLLATVKTTAG